MALAAVVDSIDTVPEAFRGEYAEKDGKFYLNIEGVDNHHSVANLKGALGKERDANGTLKKMISGWEQLGLSRDEIAELISKNESAAAEALRKKGDVEGILKQHQTKWDKEKGELTTRAERGETAARKAVVKSGLLGELAKNKAMLDQPGASDFLTDRLDKRVKTSFDEDGELVVSILAADGKSPMAGSGPDGFATLADLAKEAVTTWPHLFEGNGTGGGNAPRKGGKTGEKIISRGDFDKLDPLAKATKIKEGFAIVDA